MIPKRYVIYFRAGRECMDGAELEAASKYFTCVKNRTLIQAGDLVIPRYSYLPFGKELEEDVTNLGAKIINSWYQHSYIADLQNYVADLQELTPLTWSRLEDIPDDGSAFVLKGATNSKKWEWNKKMFAPDKRTAIQIYGELSNDSFIGLQEIYIRKYEPLITYLTGINGLPITKEFRFFIAYGKVISSAYYWSGFDEELEKVPSPEEVPAEFLERAIDRLRNKVDLLVLDIAQKTDGSWIVIECNSLNMSGLSMNNPEILYSNLRQVLEEQYGMQESY